MDQTQKTTLFPNVLRENRGVLRSESSRGFVRLERLADRRRHSNRVEALVANGITCILLLLKQQQQQQQPPKAQINNNKQKQTKQTNTTVQPQARHLVSHTMAQH